MAEPIVLNEKISYFPSVETPLSSDVIIIKTDTGYCIFDVGNNSETTKYINDLKGQKTVVISHFHIDHTSELKDFVYDSLYVGKNTFDAISNAKKQRERRLSNPEKYVPNNGLADGHTEPGIGDYDNIAFVDFEKTVTVREATCILNGNSAANNGFKANASDETTVDDGTTSDTVQSNESNTEKVGNCAHILEVIPFPSTHAKGSLVLMVDKEIAFLGDALYAKFRDESKTYNVQLLKEQMELIEALPAELFYLSHDGGKVRNKKFVLRLLNSIYSRRKPDSPVVNWIV